MTIIDFQSQFSKPLLTWFDQFGRKDLPWQNPREPYFVWISEIMLQQTQVQTVIAYFNRFTASFPTIEDLAQAEQDEVLALWSGLGYYSRARNLHATAKIIVENYQGIFPNTLEALIELPGIGPSTAAAILSQSMNLPTAILDGNVKRVLTRFFRIKGQTEQADIKRKLWDLANSCMHPTRCADYTQAIMDLGALCCTSKKPDCTNCPVQQNCQAYTYQEQLEYPTKKIKKPVPTLAQQFLVLSNKEGLVYLEKRPPSGLWGGLWCLPAIEMDDCPLGYIKIKHALKGEEPELLLSFKHRFSHFHLDIHAMSIKTQQLQNQIAESSGRWFAEEQLKNLGLAQPTQLILSKLLTSS